MKKSHINTTFFSFLVLLLIATFFSCSEVLTEKDISSSSVELIAPTNNSQLLSTGITFTWNSVRNASKYQLQIAKPNFTSPVEIILDTTITSTSFSKQLITGQYQWRVRALNTSYTTAYTSNFLTIASNADFQSNTVLLTSPVNNLITKTAIQTLTWQSVLGATAYQVQVFDSSNTLVTDQTLSATTFSYTFAQGSYQWRVRATNGNDFTLYSARSILVDLTPPNTPVLSSPTNAGSSTTNTSFSWSRVPIAGSSEKDSIYIYTDSSLNTLQSKNLATSPYSLTLSAGTTYYWRVKSFDTAGNISQPSTTYSFTVN